LYRKALGFDALPNWDELPQESKDELQAAVSDSDVESAVGRVTKVAKKLKRDAPAEVARAANAIKRAAAAAQKQPVTEPEPGEEGAPSEGTPTLSSTTLGAAQAVVEDLKKRAAMIWDISPEAVEWKDGEAVPAGANAGGFDPLPLAAIALKAAKTGGPIGSEISVNAQGAGPGFGAHICDIEVDPETGHTTILRYTAVQDVGRAIHPAYVEGQIQGGAVQGIGWALNEEYIYNAKGQVDNPAFLDYRMPVCSDLPMLDAVMLEIPNPKHPQGVRGVGEVPLVPPLGAISNAMYRATHKRFYALPMSPPRVLEKLEQAAE
jgi:CO/xanthine dehydrogenase Mo-binding subunit